MLKNYSFNVHTEKHKHIMKWLEEQKKEGMNFSALMRVLIEKEMKRRGDF